MKKTALVQNAVILPKMKFSVANIFTNVFNISTLCKVGEKPYKHFLLSFQSFCIDKVYMYVLLLCKKM